ncbi:MAG TPA: ABC transporter substrate-binding protein [Actinomycetota bacterium]|nr:ABC transporter substrate-binding protein [Actinomycetota bacterium]
MERQRRTRRGIGLALVLGLLAAACGGNGDDSGGGNATVSRGGVFRTATTDLSFTNGFDPTGEYSARGFNLYAPLLRTLVGFRRVGGAPGNELQPDLATELPPPADGGLTYTFRLRQGVKWAPPLARDVTSKDVAYAFQRINAAPLVAQYGFYYTGVIKGLDGKAKSAETKVPGIETPDDQTIIFRLAQPTADFLYRLTMSAAAPIPEEVGKCFTKAGDYGRYVMSSGPYMIQGSEDLDISSCDSMKPISGFDPSKKLYMVRNPNHDQATDTLRANNVDAIKVDVNTNLGDIFDRIERGELDASLGQEQPPKPVLQRYLTDPAKKPYLHTDLADATGYLSMNLTLPPFDDIHIRKAVNWVLDRQALLQAEGGPAAVQPATHAIPPTVLNGRLGAEYNPYPSEGNRGDEAKAKEEVKQSRYDSDKDGRCDAAACRNLVFLTPNETPYTEVQPIIQQGLAKLGIVLKPRELAPGTVFTTFQTVANKIPLVHTGWAKDYADPVTFAIPLFSGSSIIPVGNTNHALVGLTAGKAAELKVDYPAGGVPSLDADIERCDAIPASDADARMGCWADFDKQVMEQVVPWVPLGWDLSTVLAAPSLTRYVFDQASGEISLTQIAVSNKEQLS